MTPNDETNKIINDLRIIDDAFFRLIAKDPLVCQEILRTLLNDDKLIVQEVDTQKVLTNIHREIILDALCTLGDGSLCNIEVQKSENNDDVKRIRFHTSSVTVNNTKKGTKFEDIPNIKVIYITTYDVFGNNQVITNICRCLNQNDKYYPIDDGEEIIIANASIRNQTVASELLQLFLQKDEIHDKRFPNLCKKFNYFKKEGGRTIMCDIVQQYAEQYAEEYAKIQKAICIIEVCIELGQSKEQVLKKLQEKLDVSPEQANDYYEAFLRKEL